MKTTTIYNSWRTFMKVKLIINNTYINKIAKKVFAEVAGAISMQFISLKDDMPMFIWRHVNFDDNNVKFMSL